jgi:site-specific recombinase XerD
MKSTFRILFYAKRDKQKADGTVPIWCRITVDGQATRFSTKSSINPNSWDSKAAKASGRSKEATEINSLLDKIRTSIYNVYHDLLTRENDVSAERVKNMFLGIEVKHQTILELFRRHNEDVEKLVGISKTKTTLQKYDVAYRRLADFIKLQYSASDVSLKEINHMFISDFEIYLKTCCKCGSNTTAKFMQRFRTIILMAKNNGWIHTDPFANYKIRFQKVDKGYLTQEQIEILMRKTFSTKRLEQVRDIFVFSCFSGLAYIDVKNLRETNIRTSFDGGTWIMGKREKTGVNFNVPLLETPKQILDKYAGTLPGGMVLPVPSNQKMNAYLKEIGDLCGIDKELTFHLARHSFATLTLSKGVSIESVSKMLGHTNIKTTQIYAKITDAKISNDMAAFAEKLDTKKRKSPSKLDSLFECLSLGEKMALFNLPQTLSSDAERGKRISLIWHSLSDEEKSSLWANTFENEDNFAIGRENANYRLTAN